MVLFFLPPILIGLNFCIGYDDDLLFAMGKFIQEGFSFSFFSHIILSVLSMDFAVRTGEMDIPPDLVGVKLSYDILIPPI